VVCAAIVPGSAAERPATAMNTFAGVFRIRSRSRSGVRWAEATTISCSTPNSSSSAPAFFPTSESVLEPRTISTSTGIAWDKEASDQEADADLPALPAPEIGRERAGDQQEQGERQQQDGQECQRIECAKCHVLPSELDPGQSLGVDDPRDRTDLVDDDLTKDIEIL